MNKDLTNKLLNKYPKIFMQHTLPCTETAMCWLFECGDGWYRLLDMLCFQLQFNTDKNSYPQVEATQVKEKYGGLRFYYIILASDKENKWRERHCGVIDGIVSFAEYLSEETCEKCGSTGDASLTEGSWLKTLCKRCKSNIGLIDADLGDRL